MLVQDLMVRNVVMVPSVATIREAIDLMRQHHVKSLVVDRRDAHDVYGIITYSNILETIVAEEGDIELINVYDVCAKPAITINVHADVKHAARLMVNMRLRRLLAMDGNTLAGIITKSDIVGYILTMAHIELR